MEGLMIANLDKQMVHELALNLSLAIDCRTRIETERRTVFGRDVIELRVFLLEAPSRIAVNRWVSMYCERLAEAVDSAGLEFVADECFTPSQRFPSCGFWVASPIRGRWQRRMSAVKTA
jgi:hypothetical protein